MGMCDLLGTAERQSLLRVSNERRKKPRDHIYTAYSRLLPLEFCRKVETFSLKSSFKSQKENWL